ncbi:1-phosphofructokinase family hexose kinase [Hymenobacter jejuensis]|uniref:1-phosphofructokinase family hexose kinase n=1 Tax=Hymenobacter jejuensis TaxID=2502781 RepID=A0A5B7ZYF7_9BACT|nr:1-phosphofructokinase family hexose kinase [Hymenobacter jejuensis]QDA59536.1 1-phosphofructokinase family hexose kinase [Hymenobacter jejuensis]
MNRIVTLTLNPAIDKSTSVDKLVPEHKMRCVAPKLEPGGGGINVSRGLKRLGLESLALFPAGGPAGLLLQELLEREHIAQHAIAAANWTRENFIVVDSATNQQYRFGMPGTLLLPDEQAQVLRVLQELTPAPEFLVISGSMPPGVAPDFLVEVVRRAHAAGTKVIADTSGPALERIVEEGVYLIKPNVGELARMAGVDELDSAAVGKAAKALIAKGKCEIIVVSLGPQGACVVTQDMEDHVPAPAVKKRSTVGAGDSMVAGMLYALSTGKSVRQMVRLGVACGTAATMNSGTELFKPSDAEKLYQWLLRTMSEHVLD